MSKDYYSILGVDKSSSPDEIKKSYRKLSKKYHPDISKEEGAEDKFKEISEAYSVLSNAEKKSNYDLFGTPDGGGFGGGFGGGSPFGDMFDNDFFENFFGRRSNQHQYHKKKTGSDIKIRIGLSLDEIEVGGQKTIRYKRKTTCKSCKGKGGENIRECIGCNGTGKKVVTQRTPIGIIRNETICDNCSGKGKIINDRCKSCHGNGQEEKTETLEFDIPIGVLHGVSYRYDGKGNENENGSGNLIIEFVTNPHSKYSRINNNLMCDLNLPFNVLITGGKINIEGLNSKILQVDIPSKTKPGYKLRLKGQGLPSMENSMRGDIIINIGLEFPDDVNDKEMEIISQLNTCPNFIYKSNKNR